MIRIVALCLALPPFVLAGCSDDDPEAVGPPSTPLPSVAVSSPTKDGRTADPEAVAKVVALVTNPESVSAPLGIEGVRSFYRMKVRTMGLTPEEASCTADQLVAAGGPQVGDSTMTDVARSSVGVDPSVLSQCLSAARLQELANTPPDDQRVPGSELREFMVQISSNGMASVGLSRSEANCVATEMLEPISDADMAQAYSGELATIQNLPEAVATCLTKARIDELAED